MEIFVGIFSRDLKISFKLENFKLHKLQLDRVDYATKYHEYICIVSTRP